MTLGAIGETPPLPFRALIFPPEPAKSPLRVAGWLTPYDVETIAMDAQRAGRGARLQLTLAESASENNLRAVRAQFAPLRVRGIEVSIRRGGQQ
jgi:hypothetical protein